MNSPDSWILALSWLDRLIEAVRSPSYNLKVIYLGVTSLGLAAGVCGCFLLFRKRSLLSDTIGHSTLPGVCIAFLLFAPLGLGRKVLYRAHDRSPHHRMAVGQSGPMDQK